MRAYENIKQTNKMVVCMCAMLPDFHHHLLILFLLLLLLLFLLPFVLLEISLREVTRTTI